MLGLEDLVRSSKPPSTLHLVHFHVMILILDHLGFLLCRRRAAHQGTSHRLSVHQCHPPSCIKSV